VGGEKNKKIANKKIGGTVAWDQAVNHVLVPNYDFNAQGPSVKPWSISLEEEEEDLFVFNDTPDSLIRQAYAN
jgi:hypothetical protein